MIATKREKEAWKRRIREAFVRVHSVYYSPRRPLTGISQDWEAKLRRRPIFKGSFIRPTMDNKLLPRLIPQPAHITGMILRRRIARERRWEQRDILKSWTQDLRYESLFEYALLKSARGEAVKKATPLRGRVLESHAHRCASEVVEQGREPHPWTPVYTGRAKTKWGGPYVFQKLTTLTVCIRGTNCDAPD